MRLPVDLEVELAEARAELERERARADALERALAIVASARPVDDAAERRRAKDRERKKKRAGQAAALRGIPQTSADFRGTPSTPLVPPSSLAPDPTPSTPLNPPASLEMPGAAAPASPGELPLGDTRGGRRSPPSGRRRRAAEQPPPSGAHQSLAQALGAEFRAARGEQLPWATRGGALGSAVQALLAERPEGVAEEAHRAEVVRRWGLALRHPVPFHRLDTLTAFAQRYASYGPEGAATQEAERAAADARGIPRNGGAAVGAGDRTEAPCAVGGCDGVCVGAPVWGQRVCAGHSVALVDALARALVPVTGRPDAARKWVTEQQGPPGGGAAP